jgi:nucleotide-binding universal stress UspA family protein
MPKSILKSVLVSIDRSSDSTPAMELALGWARRFEAELVGVGFIDEYSVEVAQEYLYKEGLLTSVNPPLIARIQQDYRRVLEQYAARCAAAGVSCTTPAETGLSLDRVLFEAQRHDLIVMDRLEVLIPGFEGPQAQNLGRILKNSPRPVVLVPPHGAVGDHGEVVVAYDGSLQSARALYAAAFSVLESDVKVHIVSVATARAVAAGAADQAVAFLRLHQVDAVPHPIESHESPATVILEQADRIGAGLVVMGAYGEPVLREFFLGSVSRTILKESKVPVFLAH